MHVCSLHRGTIPLLVSLPHDGTALPDGLASRLTPEARGVPDTDWFVSRLYDFARGLGASVLVPTFSRYVVDLNRPPDDGSLYPGQNTTGLFPVRRFDGGPVYLPGQEATAEEMTARLQRYWQPYHQALLDELARIWGKHGRAVLWEGHSIRSVVPFLFEGRLPDLNLGTANGVTCLAATQERLTTVLGNQDEYRWVANGRFKGGYITRHYGQPGQGVEAVQLELSQCTYMDETALHYDPVRAAKLQALLSKLLLAALG